MSAIIIALIKYLIECLLGEYPKTSSKCWTNFQIIEPTQRKITEKYPLIFSQRNFIDDYQIFIIVFLLLNICTILNYNILITLYPVRVYIWGEVLVIFSRNTIYPLTHHKLSNNVLLFPPNIIILFYETKSTKQTTNDLQIFYLQPE